MAHATILLIAIMALLMFLAIRYSIWRSAKAVCEVMDRFRSRNAVRAENARSLKELGLSFWPQFFRIVRDYKPYALNFLVQHELIQQTIDERFYLAEDKVRDRLRLQCPVRTRGTA